MAHPGQPQFSPAQEPGTVSPLDLPEMEKLLTKVGGQDDKPLKLSKSPSGALDLEQGCHSLPFKVVSEGHREASLPQASSRASSRRASSIATTSYTRDREVPKDYLVLAITSCFCPIWPLNLIPLIFSIMSRSSMQQGDLDGARRLGRLAGMLSVTFIILGVVIIIVAVAVNFADSIPDETARTYWKSTMHVLEVRKQHFCECPKVAQGSYPSRTTIFKGDTQLLTEPRQL
ncbi:trafficking regulator of GLUT4 1 isoform X1 [Pseudorca crassidens]|uniref:trafficking regulator of GLUT4 1 isoform X1 n=1 Tax=Pseudorca crassidens TaxID=82174 RepID=UPI00352CBB21